jgi:hypothetical protein
MNARDAFRSRTFARDRRTWIATFAAATLLWVGTSAWLNRRVTLAPRPPAAPGSDGRFVALAFDRIVRAADGKNLDRFRLRDELRALAQTGWNAVTLEELRNAYGGTASLPAKPILLTFDEGYLGTYEAADPVLRELRWPAVMFLRTERQEARDVSFLFWDRLQRMRQSGVWELASGDPPAATASAPPGVALIETRSGGAIVPAWAPRGVDPLAAAEAGAGAGNVTARSADGPVPWLGFMDDPVGANDPAGSPFRIARLRVDPQWTPRELLDRLDAAVAPARGGAAVWVPGEGTATVDAGSVRLTGRPSAELWIPSARWIDDWSLDLRLRPDSGEFWVVQPAGTPGREWRFGGTESALYVEDVARGRAPVVLARITPSGSARGPHRVRVVKRGSGLSVAWDGGPAPSPIALPERWRGRVGLIAYRRDTEAALTVDGLELSPYPYTVRSVAASPAAGDVAALAAEATAIAAVSPVWVTIDGDLVRETPFDHDLFRILARRYAWDILPGVVVVGPSAPGEATKSWLGALAATLARDGYAGVRLDLSGLSGETAAGWREESRALGDEFRRAGLRLVVDR